MEVPKQQDSGQIMKPKPVIRLPAIVAIVVGKEVATVAVVVGIARLLLTSPVEEAP